MNKFILIFMFYTLSGSGQVNKIQIVDAETSIGIPFVKLFCVQKKEGYSTDYNGYIFLNFSLNKEDSCLISCIGYETRILPALSLFEQSNNSIKTIQLNPINKTLEEVYVSAKKEKPKQMKLGVLSKSKTMFFGHYLTGETGDQLAVWIPNKKSVKGYIDNINIYITDIGYPNAYFRLHIYDCSQFEIKPAKELTKKNIVVNGNLGNEWVNIDIKKLNIPISENGFFVGIEWFSKNAETLYSDTIVYDGARFDTVYTKVYSGNGCVLGTIDQEYTEAKNKLWKKTNLEEWENKYRIDENKFNKPDTLNNGYISYTNEKNLYLHIPCINATIRYLKEKNKSVFRQPKKRKLDRIVKTKEDLFQYPQNSIENLFSSIIKTFEEDNIIYLLKYLCVYQEDEFKILLEEVKKDTISETEKKKIITKLSKIKDGLGQSQLIPLGAGEFELIVDKEKFILIVADGKWKINPYSSKANRSIILQYEPH